MNPGVCDCAWSAEDEEAAFVFLSKVGVRDLGLSPYRYFSDLGKVTSREAGALRRRLKSRGFRVDRLLDFFMERAGVRLFSGEGTLGFRTHFVAVLDLAEALGATYVVYSGPSSRVVSTGLGASRLFERAVEEFDFLGWQAGRRGVRIGVMALPPSYGGNFLSTDAEVCRFVTAVRSPSICWHADTGGMALNGTRLRRGWLAHCGGLHVSEAGYGPMVGAWLGHVGVASVFRGQGIPPFLEVVPGSGVSGGLGALFRGLRFCRELYC